MKTTSVYVALLTLPLFIMGTYPKQNKILSSGAPASSTGAPGEVNCTLSGCHDDNNINAGGALLSLSFNNGNNYYEAGKTYPVKISISEPNKIRFGFQVVAIKNGDLSNAGAFAITDSIRTQILKNDIQLLDREYATYTYNGTLATQNGKSEWDFNWTAPNTENDEITFYIAGVSANNDGTDNGDYVYTTNIKINPLASSVNQVVANKKMAEIGYDVHSKNISVINNNPNVILVSVYDLTGREIFSSKLNPYHHTLIGVDTQTAYIVVVKNEKGQKLTSKITAY